MNNGIIVDCYQKMTKVELNRLSFFVESPYYNKHEPTKKLHYYLLNQYPDFDEKKCKKEVVFQAVFGNIAFKNQQLKDVIFKLTSLLQQFLVAEKMKENTLLSRRMEIEILFAKNMSKLVKKSLNKAAIELESESKTSKYFHHKSEVSGWANNYEEIYGDRLKSSVHLQEKSDNLDYFYFAEKMLMGAFILNRSKLLQIEFSMPFYDELEMYLNKNEAILEKEPYVKLNLLLYQLLKKEDESIYYSLKKQVVKTPIDKSELKVYYTFLRNYCTRKINGGNSSFLKELFELHQLMMVNDAILDSNILSEWTYKNFITVALRLKKYDWTKKFIEDYSKYLNASIYENAYSYNMANLHYAEGNYTDAMRLLLYVNYTDVVYLLDSKALLLKIYFEDEEFEAAESLLHSFRLLTMRQQKISTKKKKSFLNLIRITDKILRLKRKKTTLRKEEFTIALNKIKSKIDKADALANKTWVLEQWKKLDEN